MNANRIIRFVGTILVLGIAIPYLPGFQTVDLFTFAVITIGVAVLGLWTRPFIELEMGALTPVTLGIPVFVVMFVLLVFLTRFFPGFTVVGYWQIPLVALLVALVHIIAEAFISKHHPVHHH